ncbi:MAG: glycosyltransferase family 2 protein [Phycisphaeraceae bacterium]|nr:glycosyltransferase family 2 protein [Phycisphaeraceae bacterium]
MTETSHHGPVSADAGPLLSIIVPVFNEERTIHPLLERLLALPIRPQIIVVNDASTDTTAARLETIRNRYPHVQVLHHALNRGKGAAIRTGLMRVKGEIVAIQDADLEYHPEDLLRLLHAMVRRRLCVIYGSRFSAEIRYADSWSFHWLINRFLTMLANLVTGQNLTDMETCYKLVRREVITQLRLRENGFGFEPELTIALSRRGLRIVEMPVSYQRRTAAQGKKIGWRDGFRTLYALFRYALLD